MYIYFEDGKLRDINTIIEEIGNSDGKSPGKQVYKIDAGQGFTLCSMSVRNLYNYSIKKNAKRITAVYTNSLACLSNVICWNDETHQCDLFLRDKFTEEWHRAQDYTEKEIRQGHNLMAMVMNGVFNDSVIMKPISERDDLYNLYCLLLHRRNKGEKLSDEENVKLSALRQMFHSHYGATGCKDE